MIVFNIPPYTGKELHYISQAVEKQKICGDGEFTKKCSQWIEKRTGTGKCLLTTSCTHATELAALLADVGPGDEVIMPSYTFVSTANAFVLRGATPVFVDIRPDTMNIDENLIEAAVTDRTKAILPVHYAGVSCEMDKILEIARAHDLFVIEDAAQGIMSTYKGRPLGTIGDFGAFSFHETKNYSMGEGGALLIRDEKYVEEAEILREKGTNRSQFFRGQVDKYGNLIGGVPIHFQQSNLQSELVHRQQGFEQFHILNIIQHIFHRVNLGWRFTPGNAAKICTRVLQFLIKTSVRIEHSPVPKVKLFNRAFVHAAGPQYLFFSQFPTLPFSFFSAMIV